MKTRFYNIGIDVLNTPETLEICKEYLESDKTRTLFFINAHCFNIAQKNDEYREALKNADLVLNDGIGVSIGAKIKGIGLKENMNGTDFIPRLLKFAKERKEKIFLLGGKPGIAELAAKNLVQNHPGILVTGYADGYFEDQNEVIHQINSSGATLLVCGMGVPLQEIWISKNRDRFSNLRIAIAGGAILDFLSGNVSRAPGWIRKAGMEWGYRLMLEPKRLWKRYLVGNVIFFYHIISFLVKKKIPEGQHPGTAEQSEQNLVK